MSGGALPPDPELADTAGAASAGLEVSDGGLTPGERLGIVAYTNVAPLHWGLEPWEGSRFFRGVPTALNAKLLAGELDLTLVSSVEFIRHRDRLVALPDFSIATLGPVLSVMLFHHRPWQELDGGRVAVTSESATSVELLRVLFEADGMSVELVPVPTDLEAMLGGFDGALLIGDAALVEGAARRPLDGLVPLVTDLGEAWYRLTALPFTFAVWAAEADRPPSARLVEELRATRERGLGHLAEVVEVEAAARGLPEAVVLHYLANFRYYLSPPDRDGLEAFAARVDPDYEPGTLRFWDL